MTPAERARLIDKQEFEAECKAARKKALRYAAAKRKEEAARLAAILAADTPAPKPKAGVVPTGRKPKLYSYNGESKSLSEWATEFKIDYHTLGTRLRNGIPLERALTMKPRQRAKLHTVNGISMSLQEWASHIGISYDALMQRLRKRSLAEAIAMPQRENPKAGTLTDTRTVDDAPGVSANSCPMKGTGAGGIAQEILKISFPSDEAHR